MEFKAFPAIPCLISWTIIIILLLTIIQFTFNSLDFKKRIIIIIIIIIIFIIIIIIIIANIVIFSSTMKPLAREIGQS